MYSLCHVFKPLGVWCSIGLPLELAMTLRRCEALSKMGGGFEGLCLPPLPVDRDMYHSSRILASIDSTRFTAGERYNSLPICIEIGIKPCETSMKTRQVRRVCRKVPWPLRESLETPVEHRHSELLDLYLSGVLAALGCHILYSKSP